MVHKFRKKQIEVEAIQLNGNGNKHEIESFVGRALNTVRESEFTYLAGTAIPVFSLLIETKEGIMKAFRGDWIIKEPFPTGDRDFYPCKSDIFMKTYEEVTQDETKEYTILQMEQSYDKGFKDAMDKYRK